MDERITKTLRETSREAPKTNISMTPEERRAVLRNEWVNEVLPTPPEIPGWHVCWLSTTNQADSVMRRIGIGYVPVQTSEVPKFASMSVKGGEFDGYVACNEMLLFKLPNEVYNDLMTIYHADMPSEMEQAIYDKVQSGQERDSSGRPVMTVEGDFERLRQSGRAPSFV